VKFKPLHKIDTADGSHTLSVRDTVTFFVSLLSTWNFYCIGSKMYVFNVERVNN